MKTILAPIDFSPVNHTVADAAIRLSRMIKGRLVFVHVVEPPSRAQDVFPDGEVSDEAMRAVQRAAGAKLATLKKQWCRRYDRVSVLQLTGDPVDCLVAEARKRAADYLVIGTHGDGAVFDLLVGSVARGVLLQAPCPVLVVSAVKAAERNHTGLPAPAAPE